MPPAKLLHEAWPLYFVLGQELQQEDFGANIKAIVIIGQAISETEIMLVSDNARCTNRSRIPANHP